MLRAWSALALIFCAAAIAGAAVQVSRVENAGEDEPELYDVTFTFRYPYADSVYVLGTFNGWELADSSSMVRSGDSWVKTVRLARGDYQYKFRVIDNPPLADDGWMHDRENPQYAVNEFGTFNSLVSAGGLLGAFHNREFASIEDAILKLVEHQSDRREARKLSALYESLVPRVDEETWNRLDEWATASPEFHGVHILRGTFLIDRAWKSRGSGWAYTVADDSWAMFKADLDAARVELEKAFRLEPRDPNSSAYLITVSMGQGSSYEVMDAHFMDAIQASPAHTSAHIRKAQYLYGRWMGRGTQLRDFVREFAEKIRDNPDLFTVALNAHRDLYNYPQRNPEYYRLPGVWDELLLVYGYAFESHPDKDYVYTNFIHDAMRAEPRAQRPVQANRLKIDRVYWAEMNDLAYMLATHPRADHRRGDAAVAIALRVTGIVRLPQTLDTLSAAYAEEGDFASALQVMDEALKMPMADKLRRELAAHAETLRRGEPIREGAARAASPDRQNPGKEKKPSVAPEEGRQVPKEDYDDRIRPSESISNTI